MKYKPEDVKLVITHNGDGKEAQGLDESTCIQNPPPKKIKVEVVTTKSSRCNDTIDWVELEYGDAYKKPYVNKKPKKGEVGY